MAPRGNGDHQQDKGAANESSEYLFVECQLHRAPGLAPASTIHADVIIMAFEIPICQKWLIVCSIVNS